MSNPLPQQEPIRVHVFVSGRVQGVGFRYSTMNKASRLGIKGWVRNVPDGRVEAVFEGSQKLVEEMIDWCQKGSRGALVKDVAVEYEQPKGLLKFKIEH